MLTETIVGASADEKNTINKVSENQFDNSITASNGLMSSSQVHQQAVWAGGEGRGALGRHITNIKSWRDLCLYWY